MYKLHWVAKHFQCMQLSDILTGMKAAVLNCDHGLALAHVHEIGNVNATWNVTLTLTLKHLYGVMVVILILIVTLT